MKPLFVFFFATLFLFSAGCSSSQPDSDITLPILIHQQPLPAYPGTYTASMLRLPLELHITREGTVSDVLFVRSSGDASWDSAASAVIRTWRYAPAKSAGAPVPIWIHQTAVIRFSDPQPMELAELVCPDQRRADSAYVLLQSGVAFSEAVRRFSCGESRVRDGDLGTVNIQSYPDHVRQMLKSLKKGSFTEPILLGDRYAIFYRLPE